MHTAIFTKSRIATAMSLALAGTLSWPALAQQTDATATAKSEEKVEVIEIKGIRGSLIRSMDIKREANGVVDAISAEEMGKFPDTNLAESLQRITGVSVSRANGEGSQITVRGFGPDFNLVTLNGRQMPGTGYTRSYNLENLSSEGVSALEVYKTARAENPSGGLGATVNIITTKPLNNPGQHASVSAKGIYDSSNKKGDDVTPEFALVVSDTMLDDKFGVALSFSHQERDFQKQQANIQGWQANVALPNNLAADKIKDARPLGADGKPGGNYYFPKDMNYSIEDVERERSNGQLTFQFAPVDNFVATLDYTASRAMTGSESIGWGIWNEFGGNINAYELDANGTALYADISGNDGSFTANKGSTEVKADSVGLNLDWQLHEDFGLSFDYHDSSNKTDNGADKGLGSQGQVILGSDQLLSKVYDFRQGEVPHAMVYWKNGTDELKAGEIDSNFSQFIHSPGEAKIKQAQLDSEWNNNIFSLPLSKVNFGIARTEQTMGGHQGWSGLRGGPGFNPAYPQIFPDAMFVRHSTSDFLDAFNGGGSALKPHYYYSYSFDEAVARQLAFLTADVMGADVYSIDPYIDGIDSESSVEEKTDSVYLQSQWEGEWLATPMWLNVGVRYEKTDVTSLVRQRVETQVNWESASEWITQYQQGGSANFLEQSGEHDVVLPMFDFKAELTDDLVARFSWGKSISRAPLGFLAGGRSLSGSPKPGARSGGQGNTNLLPFESTNLDLSLEYYYAEGSYAAVGWFKKDVDNFIQTTITETTIEGLRDILNGPRYLKAVADITARGEQPTSTAIFEQMLANGNGNSEGKIEPAADDPLMVWNISQPANTDSKSVDGVEVAMQHLLWDTGFGVGANATFVQGDVEFDVTSLQQQAPLTGLSDSANLQLFYENYGWSVKVTYTWRDKYLIGVGQAQGSSDAPPQFAKSYGQWDLSVNYDVTPELTVFFEGINLNDETERGYGRYEEQFLFARQYGPRLTLGMRYALE
ncbi:TonB-dependent receptor [Rheinheimera sp.]|uniref:TonB-dependent receptor n=1 Tax=Rheinheimera sp. TaxID=1869214 RepID=UPI0027B9EA95|nr:TonB-dependent receptor [Rheinheimera sp.]